MELADALGRGVRAERARAGIAQAELADAVGKSRAWVGAVERGAIDVSLRDALALCRALGVSLATLLADLDAEEHRAVF